MKYIQKVILNKCNIIKLIKQYWHNKLNQNKIIKNYYNVKFFLYTNNGITRY